MIMDEVNKEIVEKAFRLAYTYKSDAKEANASASATLNDLAMITSGEKSKEGIKRQKKVIRKAYKEWQERIEGDNTSDQAIEIADAIVGENDE